MKYNKNNSIIQTYNKKDAMDTWIKDNMGNTKIKNYDVFNKNKNKNTNKQTIDLLPARLPPLYYQKYQIYFIYIII